MRGNHFDILANCTPAETYDLILKNGVYKSIGSNPQLVFDVSTLDLRGCWSLEFDVEAVRGALKPRLYVSLERNFEERFSHGFDHLENNRFSITFVSLLAIKRLRIDPVDSLGTFKIKAIRLKRVSVRDFMRATLAQAEDLQFTNIQKLRIAKFAAGAVLKKGMTFARLPKTLLARLSVDNNYAAWIARFDYSSRNIQQVKDKIAKLPDLPAISVVMPVYNTPLQLLDKAIGSVVDQIYPRWELCIADDASTDRRVNERLQAWQAKDQRIRVVFRDNNGHISEATNSAFELVKYDWVALLDHDDELRPHALAEVAFAIAERPGAELIYSDEDKIDENGHRFEPYFKPNFSIDMFRSQNYLNHLTVHRAGNIRAAGEWRKGFEGSQDYDINLRIIESIDQSKIVHIPKILYHWRATEHSTAKEGSQKDYAIDAAERALCQHIERLGIEAKVERLLDIRQFRIKYSVPSPAPLVSLIIPTRDNVNTLKKCLESILSVTEYPNYEVVVVDNQSRDRTTLDYLAKISANKKVKVLKYNKKFNYSAINNFAVGKVKGLLVGLLNDDVEIISSDWLAEMASHALRPEIGCVGAKLYYPDGRVQHAGVILGVGGVAGHAHKYAAKNDSGYFNRLKIIQNVSAVTGACLLIRREVYKRVGGLDARHLAVAYNDVDFCLRVGEIGLRNLWTPFAELVHHESISRGSDQTGERQKRFRSETIFMLQRWKCTLLSDPYYSPNLTLDRENFHFRSK